MSKSEYNNLLYKISKRLDRINAGEQVLVICRGQLEARNEENIPTYPLFQELEMKGYLCPDRLVVLKRILQGVKEWDLFGEVETFESKRKEYSDLLGRIVRELDELNDLDRLVSICKENIPEERQNNIHNVRSLFAELENIDLLEVDVLDTLKKILTQTDKNDLLKAVEEFEQRKRRELNFERRKAKATAIVSSVGEKGFSLMSTAYDKVTGVLNVKTAFKVVAGGLTIAASLDVLTRACEYEELIQAVSTCVLPAGTNLMSITSGCVCLKVQVENIAALETLWLWYQNGMLKARLQAFFVTDEIRELAEGEQVEVAVTIDEQEYENARKVLVKEAKAKVSMSASEGPDVQREEWQEKYASIQSYLEQTKDSDSHSATTETSDSGMWGSQGAQSELGIGETSDSVSNLCLKDLSKAVTAELECRLQVDPIALQRFHQSFGLDPEKVHPRRMGRISKFFPDTPVKLLRDAFDELQLYDLVDLLERAPRTLRPAIPLKEMSKLPNAGHRLTKIYNQTEVLIIECSDADDNSAKIGSFFKSLNSQSQVTTLTAKASAKLVEDLEVSRERMKVEEFHDWQAEQREKRLKELLEKKIPYSRYNHDQHMSIVSQTNEELLKMFYEEEPAMRNELAKLTEEREHWTNERKAKIEKDIIHTEEKLRGEHEKLQIALSRIMERWISRAHDEGAEPTLHVVLYCDKLQQFVKTIQECVGEKLATIPNTKLVITNAWSLWDSKKIPRETIFVHYWYTVRQSTLATILEILTKRWRTLDLISVMQEVQRTLPIKITRGIELVEEGAVQYGHPIDVFENLSCLPRLQNIETRIVIYEGD